jgi:hypothetical protein
MLWSSLRNYPIEIYPHPGASSHIHDAISATNRRAAAQDVQDEDSADDNEEWEDVSEEISSRPPTPLSRSPSPLTDAPSSHAPSPELESGRSPRYLIYHAHDHLFLGPPVQKLSRAPPHLRTCNCFAIRAFHVTHK